jgi:hypothetical protein
LARAGAARLLVIEPGTPIPALADGEDWIHSTADERDVLARLAALGRRRPPAGRAVVTVLPASLSTEERRVAARLLIEPGALVPRADLPVDDLAATLRTVGRALRPLGHVIRAVGDAGYLIEPIEEPPR